jgi:glycosyltransferase involved in cell wall biosynthesis
MKLLYITPMTNGEGGIQKVLSIKTNYLIENYDYQIDILTQDDGNKNLFFDFNTKIGFYDMILPKNKLLKFYHYRNRIQKQIKISKPDCIIVCDAGLKAFLLPIILNQKIPLLFEIHGSKYNESQYFKSSYLNLFFRKIKYFYKSFFIKFYDKVIFLSNESLQEWNLKNGIVIPNSLNKKSEAVSDLKPQKIIVIARHSYEKGLDKLFLIWKKVSQKYPDWILEIYGTGILTPDFINQMNLLEISNSVKLLDPIKNISDKFLEASMCLMTSRQEGLPMVLIEAMNFGLPCIAYDCPIGPRAIISNNENGFLIENDNENDFINAVCKLIENENLRIKMGKNAKKSSGKYQIEPIMEMWNDLFKCTIKP